MADTLDLSSQKCTGRPIKVLMQGTAGNIRLVTLPPDPLLVTIGPAYDTDGETPTGQATYSIAAAGTYTNNAAEVAVADGANRGDVPASSSRMIRVAGLGPNAQLALSSGTANGFVELHLERIGEPIRSPS